MYSGTAKITLETFLSSEFDVSSLIDRYCHVLNNMDAAEIYYGSPPITDASILAEMVVLGRKILSDEIPAFKNSVPRFVVLVTCYDNRRVQL